MDDIDPSQTSQKAPTGRKKQRLNTIRSDLWSCLKTASKQMRSIWFVPPVWHTRIGAPALLTAGPLLKTHVITSISLGVCNRYRRASPSLTIVGRMANPHGLLALQETRLECLHARLLSVATPRQLVQSRNMTEGDLRDCSLAGCFIDQSMDTALSPLLSAPADSRSHAWAVGMAFRATHMYLVYDRCLVESCLMFLERLGTL
ncbi:hypothetical protein F4780DRAFT_173556 [Xylariomycetidae sp. FL0641]|nr:hypothetical protein F4780DRAFT_173556 [Xylariomycetidae sp. FL0641]